MEKTTDKFADEQDILDVYINGEYPAKKIISDLVPDEVKKRYNEYCSERNRQDTEDTAAAFLDWWYSEENDSEPSDDELLDEEEIPDDASQGYQAIFSEWNKEHTTLSELSTSESACDVTLWRWENPTETNKQKCALETDVPITDVEKWWNTPDWINGYVGGHFNPTAPKKMDKKKLEAFLIDACRRTLEAQ